MGEARRTRTFNINTKCTQLRRVAATVHRREVSRTRTVRGRRAYEGPRPQPVSAGYPSAAGMGEFPAKAFARRGRVSRTHTYAHKIYIHSIYFIPEHTLHTPYRGARSRRGRCGGWQLWRLLSTRRSNLQVVPAHMEVHVRILVSGRTGNVCVWSCRVDNCGGQIHTSITR